MTAKKRGWESGMEPPWESVVRSGVDGLDIELNKIEKQGRKEGRKEGRKKGRK